MDPIFHRKRIAVVEGRNALTLETPPKAQMVRSISKIGVKIETIHWHFTFWQTHTLVPLVEDTRQLLINEAKYGVMKHCSRFFTSIMRSWGWYQRNCFIKSKRYFLKRNCLLFVMRNGKSLWWRSYTYQRISFRFPDTDDISFVVKWCPLYQILRTYQTTINFKMTFFFKELKLYYNLNCLIQNYVPDFFHVILQQSNTESMQVAKL